MAEGKKIIINKMNKRLFILYTYLAADISFTGPKPCWQTLFTIQPEHVMISIMM